MDPRRTYLPSINALACSKAEIQSLCIEYKLFLHCAESLKHDDI